MSYSNQPYSGGKVLLSDNTVIDVQDFLESGEIVAETVASPSIVESSEDGIVRQYDNFSPYALKIITPDNEIIDLIDFLKSGQLKVSLSGTIIANGDIDTRGYSIIDSVNDIVTVDAEILKVRDQIASISGGVIDFTTPVQFSAATAATFNGAHTYFPHEIVLSSISSVIRATNGNKVSIVSDDIDTPIDLVGNYVAVQSAICRRVSNGIYQTGNNITFGNQTQTYNISNASIFDISADGFRLGSGYRVNNITNNPSSVLDTDIPTMYAVQTSIGNAIIGANPFRGFWDASGGTYPTTGGTGEGGAIEAGNWWRISVAGTLGGEPLDVGDQLFAGVDDPGQTPANWTPVNPRVTSVFNRAGAVVAEDGDYPFNYITGLPDTATSGKLMRGNGTAWVETTAQYPDTAGASGNILKSDGTNFVSGAITGTANQIIVTSGSTLSLSSTLVLPGTITTPSYILNSDGTGYILQGTAGEPFTSIAIGSQIVATFSPSANNGFVVHTTSDFLDAVTFNQDTFFTDNIFVGSPICQLIDSTNNITLGTNIQTYNIGGNSIFDLSASGVRFGATGARVTSISTDGTLASNSDTLVSTEKAVKTYVDSYSSTTFVSVTTSSQSLAANNVYYVTYVGECSMALPTSNCAAGKRFKIITGSGASTVKITQASGQQVFFGAQNGVSASSTSGASGYTVSFDPNTVIDVICVVADTTFVVENCVNRLTGV